MTCQEILDTQSNDPTLIVNDDNTNKSKSNSNSNDNNSNKVSEEKKDGATQQSYGIDVWIDDLAITKEINNIENNSFSNFNIDKINWGNEKFHYFDLNNIELTVQYIFILDCLNFCFWPLEEYEYHHLAGGLKHALLNDKTKSIFNCKNLLNLDSDTLKSWLLSVFDNKKKENSNANENTNKDKNKDNDKDKDKDKDKSENKNVQKCKDIEIPLLEERVRLLREAARVLERDFDGKVINVVKSCNNSAVLLVGIMIHKFRGFADHNTCYWNGKQVFFYKRAQIFVADLYAAFQGKNIGKFDDIEQLTCFADYRVPQLLQSMGIIKLS